jgi:hypothetical protein
MILLTKLAALGNVLFALMSAYPGVLSDLGIIAILLFLMVIGGWIAFLISGRADDKAIKPELVADDNIGAVKPLVSHRRSFIASIAILSLCFVLILNGVPKRVAFVLSRSAFQRLAAKAPISEFNGEALGRRIGVYYVDRYAPDPRGGVFFRTHSGADGIGPDTMSYGFAYRPNPEGTPFGRAGYRYSHVVGDWYEFSASNDF